MKRFEVQVIRSRKQYEEYLNEIDKLMDIDPAPNSQEGRQLETLAILVEDYEKKKGWDIPTSSDPIELIRIRMEQLGLKQKDLIPVVGDKSLVSKILSGSRNLTYSMINPLSTLLRIPPELLLKG